MILSTDVKKINRTLAISGCETVSSIMMPILERHGITFFNYHKIYNDGSVLILNSDQRWATHYFKQGYINKPEYFPPMYKDFNYFLWFIKDYPELLTDAAVNFNIANGITFIIHCHDGIEYIGFGAPLQEFSVMNFYINNLELLHSYCLMFKEQAFSLIEDAEKSRIIIPENVQYPRNTTQLSAQQKHCAQLLLEGKTAKEIAKILALSPRTIEHYLEMIKHKLACKNKTDLIMKLKDDLVHQYLIY